MLKCREVLEQADAYLASELTSWQRIQFNVHLAICGYCRRYLKALKMTQQVSQQLTIQSQHSDSDISALVAMIQQDTKE